MHWNCKFLSNSEDLPGEITCSLLSGLYILSKALSCKELSLKQVEEIEAMSSAEIFGAPRRCAAYNKNRVVNTSILVITVMHLGIRCTHWKDGLTSTWTASHYTTTVWGLFYYWLIVLKIEKITKASSWCKRMGNQPNIGRTTIPLYCTIIQIRFEHGLNIIKAKD